MKKNKKQSMLIKPNQRFDVGIITCFIVMYCNIVDCKDVIIQLYKRDLFAVYKKSFLGSLWVIIGPSAAILSWLFLHKAEILRPGDVGIPYPAYVLIGTMVWGLFMGLYSTVSNTLAHYQYILINTTVAHEAVYLSQVLVKLTQFLFSFILILGVLIVFKVFPSWMVIILPFVLSPLIAIALSFGLIVSMFSVLSYDIRRLVAGVMGLILFVTPVIYSPDVINNIWLEKMVLLNPLTYLICSARDIIIYGRLYSARGFYISAALSFIFLIISLRLFYVAEDRVIERVI